MYASGNLVQPRRPWSPERPCRVGPAFRDDCWGKDSRVLPSAILRHCALLWACRRSRMFHCKQAAARQARAEIGWPNRASPCAWVVLPALGDRLSSLLSSLLVHPTVLHNSTDYSVVQHPGTFASTQALVAIGKPGYMQRIGSLAASQAGSYAQLSKHLGALCSGITNAIAWLLRCA